MMSPLCPRSGFQQDMEGSLGISETCQGEVGEHGGHWEHGNIWGFLETRGRRGMQVVPLGWLWHTGVMPEDGEDVEGTRVAPRDMEGPGLTLLCSHRGCRGQ